MKLRQRLESKTRLEVKAQGLGHKAAADTDTKLVQVCALLECNTNLIDQELSTPAPGVPVMHEKVRV